MTILLTSCPVCASISTRFFARIDRQDYRRCDTCLATFLIPAQLPSLSVEVGEYQKHNNDPNDAGYQAFLSQVTHPLSRRLPPGAQGLDYGCGPGPALANMMRQQGFAMRLYDPIFVPDETALTQRYDFITCTEVVEHFHQPKAEFERLDKLLQPGGWLAIMTCWQTDDGKFAQWHYRRDPTHVVFYKQQTLQFLAHQFGWQMHVPQKNVALMQKT